jgi:ubiquinone/menaquinone biosynthesis C-methylase UbiE
MPFFYLLGLLLLLLIFLTFYLYTSRVRGRVSSDESLDDPAVASAFARVSMAPPWRVLRGYIVKRASNLVQTGEAIDLGCGPGYLVVALAKGNPTLHVTGVDLSGEMLNQATDLAQQSGVADRVTFKQGDAQRIPFPDHSLDLIVSTLSLHHWSDPTAVFNEIGRVLRPGGCFLIFDLRRDMAPPFYLLLWFVTHVIVPGALRRVNEPMASRDASYTLVEVEELLTNSHLRDWQVVKGLFWLIIQGRYGEPAPH